MRIGPRVVNHVPARDRDIAMVFQSYALYPHLSVYENIAFGLRLKKLPKREIEARVHTAAKILGLDELLKRKPRNLSGGQRQRVAMGRAIVREPAAFLMDEPLSNLDAKLRIETRAEIRRIHKELDRATIYVTHDQDEALSLADRIVVMKDGVVQQIGTPQQIYAQPSNVHVARFMGYRNLFELEVEREGSDGVHVAGPDIRLTGVRKQPANGTRAAVAIRPEEIALGEGPGGANTIAARVDNVEYCGRDSLVDVVTSSGTRLHVRATTSPRVGDTVRVHVPADRVLVYPAETA